MAWERDSWSSFDVHDSSHPSRRSLPGANRVPPLDDPTRFPRIAVLRVFDRHVTTGAVVMAG